MSRLTQRFRFPKSLRLRSRFEFQRVARQGERRVGKFLCIDCRPSEKLRLGISASAKYGTAPERNRFKRLVREAFRKSYDRLLPSHLDLNIIPRQKAKQASSLDVMNELVHLLMPEPSCMV
ncbi:MAG: ribonuclease P protein component [Chlamydiota bacterium]